MAGVPGLISSSGGTKKPFTYCPGGINFSELKSPRMARRIAKHQSQMENTQTLPHQASSDMPQNTYNTVSIHKLSCGKPSQIFVCVVIVKTCFYRVNRCILCRQTPCPLLSETLQSQRMGGNGVFLICFPALMTRLPVLMHPLQKKNMKFSTITHMHLTDLFQYRLLHHPPSFLQFQ